MKDRATSLTELSAIDFKNATSAKDIYPLASVTNQLFKDGNFAAVDDYIANVDLGRFNTLAMVALVRFTYCAKRKLSQWEGLRDRVALRIDDPEEKLKGLYL